MASASAAAGSSAGLRPLAPGPPASVRRARFESARDLFAEFAAYAGARRLTRAGALILAGAALEGMGILLIVPLLRPMLEPGGAGVAPDTFLGSLRASARLALLLAGFAVLLAVRAAVLVGRETATARLQHGYVEAIKLRLLDRLARAPWEDVMAIDRARLVKALGSDMLQIAFAVHFAGQAAIGVLMLAALCLFAALLSPALALVTIALVLGVAAGAAVSAGGAGVSGEGQLRSDLRMAESSARFLAGLKLAKAQDLQQGFLDNYAGASRGHLASRVAFVRQVTVHRQLVAVAGALVAVGAMIAGAALAAAPAVTMIAFIVLLSRMVGPASQVLQGVQQVAHGLPVFEELRSLGAALARESAAPPGRASPSAASGPGVIALEAVSLVYPAAPGEGRGGLEDITLTIRPGEFVGLAGPSGAGKTTLLDIVALVSAPDSGGVDVGAADAAGHRRRLAYLGAEPVLFADTVRVNLAWAAPGARDAAMRSALGKAGVEGLVDRLGGLGGMLSEAGNNLSAGERQRLACARAFLRRPQLWLLDEATSSLDAAGERELVRRILAEEPRPTVLFVTHRAESLALCERVVTLADGRIAADETRRIDSISPAPYGENP